MSVERRPDERVSLAKAASDKAQSHSLFRATTHSAPLGNRKPISGAESKTILSQEELDALPKFKGDEQPVEKASDNPTIRRQARAQAGGMVTEYCTGLIHWQDPNSHLAGLGIEALMDGRTP